jgi:signal transduction histidine kinase
LTGVAQPIGSTVAPPPLMAAAADAMPMPLPMHPDQMQQLRAERVIAAGRVVLAVLSLAALWLDPLEPTRNANVAYAVLAGYALYSLLLAAVLWTAETSRPRTVLAVHALDLAVFGIVLFFSEGVTSPFFAFFVFGLMSAALRWEWRGMLWSSAVALALFLGVGIGSALLLDGEVELNRFIIRSVYLAVVAVLLAYMGIYEKRVRRELARLAAWPREGADGLAERVREVLAQATRALEVPRGLLLWEEPDEPGPGLGTWTPGAFRWSREAQDSLDTLVPPPLGGAGARSFLLPAAPSRPVLRLTDQGVERWSGPAPLDPHLRALLGKGSVLALPLHGPEGDDGPAGRRLRGWLLLAGRPALTSDDLVLGEVVAGIAAGHLLQLEMADKVRRGAAVEERMRLARELHDGVIQSLTGAALRLQTARRMVAGRPEQAAELLTETSALLAAEQRELREFISGELLGGDLVDRLRELAARGGSLWGLEVEVTGELPPEALPAGAGRDLSRIAQEALVNAARHGRARRVEMAVAAGAGRVRLEVADDGRGFPEPGRWDARDPAARGRVPETIRQRVERLGGTLVVDTGPAGTRVQVELPMDGTAAAHREPRGEAVAGGGAP